MAWIESHATLGAHPKTRKLARLLGVSRVQVVGHLQFFWWWAMDYADDGDISRFDALDIATGAEWEGDEQELLNALISSEFIDQSNGKTVIHDWQDYGGKLVHRKKANAERMRATRAEHVQNTSDARAEVVSKSVEPEESTGEYRREEDKGLSSESHAREQPDPPSRTKRSEQLPDGFELSDKRFEYAASKGMDAARINMTFEKFTTYWQRTGKPMKDWDAGWRNWVLNELDRAPALANGRASPVSTANDFRELADRLGAQSP